MTNINLTENQQQKLELYYQMLVETNEKFNLTAITDRQEVQVKHFIDSMMGQVAIKQNATVVDIGSGAGFPALPLALYRPDIAVTLVDSLHKRVEFTEQVAKVIEVNATCVHSRAEDFANEHRQTFDVATARAVAPLNILLEYTAPLVKIGGIVLAYKANDDELALAKKAIFLLGLKYNRTEQFTLPNGDNRCLIIFDKIAGTPKSYPRSGNKPRKMPL